MSNSSSSNQLMHENVTRENIDSKKQSQNVDFDWIPEEKKNVVVDYRGKFVKDYDPQTDKSLLAYPRNTATKS